MKNITTFALLSALSSVAATAAVTDPVGYVTETLAANDFNFVGVSLHEPVVVAGDFESYGTGTATDTDTDFDLVLTTGDTYMLEIDTAAGITETIATWTGSVLDTETDLSGVLSGGESYALRPAATLTSLFGADGGDLSKGFFGPGTGDQIWLYNGTGYDKFYFDSGTVGSGGLSASWVQLEPVSQEVDGADIVVKYPESFIIQSTNGGSIVLTGEVKTIVSEAKLGTGTNFVSTVTPVGATLETAFGVNGESLRPGFFGPGSGDQVWIYNGSGYDKYYYDSGTVGSGGLSASWVQLEPVAQDIADPSTIDLPSGVLVVTQSPVDITIGIPPYNL